jgi:hypothetical protein
MIDCTLAWMVGAPELLIILIILGIPFALIVLAAKHLLLQKRENIRLRLEVGKLADELEQVRKKAQGEDKGKSSDEWA